MEELKDLSQIYSSASERFNQYDGKDFVLPEVFKQQVTEINSNSISYNQYSAIIETRGNQTGVLNIFLPNQWFYIASYFTDFYNELQHYKKLALEIVSRERLKDLNGAELTSEEKNSLQQLQISEQSKSYLLKFMTDYSWWHGAKTIDRGDFYVSPILNSAKLVNASQSFVADLCAFLANKEELVKAIISGEENSTEIVKKELLREKAAATFLKKAMRITIDRDPNLTRLAALNLYKKTSKQLQINGYNLGRDKNQPPRRNDDIDANITWTFDSQEYVLYLELIPDEMEQLFFPKYNVAYSDSLQMLKDSNSGEYVLYEINTTISAKKRIASEPLQQIYYGAPGTGKSHTIKKTTDAQPKENVFRTTFHPDSDYSTFVGCYKPTMAVKPVRNVAGDVVMKEGKEVSERTITYSFTPQSFSKAYIRAWQTEEPVYLVIEEINRGNCAQIFGDLFQLLDRGDNGYSEYPIKADNDLAQYLAEQFSNNSREDIPENVKSGDELVLPSNLYIYATMNTSDQSLFPIDSAFKRRWDWEYEPIKYKNTDWVIEIGGSQYSWTSFQKEVNNKIFETTNSEDKMLGDYFVNPRDGIISKELLLNKILFYLWNDVCKDGDGDIFKTDEKKVVKFSDLYGDNGTNMLLSMMKHLKVSLLSGSADTADGEEVSDETAKQQGKSTLISIQLPNNPKILSANSTQFDAFVEALRVIGTDKIISVLSSLEYKRLGCPVISSQKEEGIINNNNRYSYQQEGNLFIIKGCKNYTYIRILEDLNELLNIGLSLETK